MCAARARDIYEREAKERQVVRKGDQAGTSPANLPDLDKGDARDKAGKAFGVSGKSVDHATRVIEKGIPELVKAVDDGINHIAGVARVPLDCASPAEVSPGHAAGLCDMRSQILAITGRRS